MNFSNSSNIFIAFLFSKDFNKASSTCFNKNIFNFSLLSGFKIFDFIVCFMLWINEKLTISHVLS